MTIVTLQYPIHSAQRGELKELAVRRPTVGDHLRAASLKNKSETEREAWMIQTLTDLSPDELEQMDLADYVACAQVMEGFLASTSERSAAPS